MSMVARTNPGPAEDDITDTDDGDTRISAGAFWPDIVLRELRLAIRLPGRVTTARLLHTATGAVAHVTRELEAWQQEQQAAGHQTLADVPAPVINGESVNLWHWRNAVYTATRALILERYRDADTTDKGDRRADALDIQTSDLWRDVSWAISDILCRPRIFAELC
ncbi:head completion/stabilization protein [Escherichia coli]|uniref:head completion/stabilization protein n=1 Tax=Escherichia coli TaxID=562 RepID=UPI003F6559D6